MNDGNMKQISAALVAAQKNFAPALKTSTNPHFRSKYADLSACIEAVIDALNAAGIMLTQKCSECHDGVIVETVFIHVSGERMESGPLHVPAVKSDPQGYGSALTYARRYSLMAACGIAPEDDDGNGAMNKKSDDKRKAEFPPKNTPSLLDEQAVASHISAIENAPTEAGLKSAFSAAYADAKAAKDRDALEKFTAAKDKAKADMEFYADSGA